MLKSDYFEKYQKYLLPLIPVLMFFLFFSRSICYEFYPGMDDYLYVVENRHLVPVLNNVWYWFKHSCIGLYTPLQMISYMFDYSIWGHNVSGYHLQNMFWHVLAVLAVYFLFVRLGVGLRTACFFAVVFAIHPQRIESVVWISERKDVMSGAFYFLCLLTWLMALERGRIFNIVTLLLMVAACLSKPLGVTLPAVMFLILIYRERKLLFLLKTFLWRLWPYVLVSLSYLLFKLVYVESIVNDLIVPDKDWTRTTLLVLNNFMFYAGKTFLPGDLVPLYPYFELSLSGIIIIALFYLCLIACCFILLRYCKPFFLYEILPPLLCFGILILPFLGFFAFSNADFADRYSYIASFFMLWLTAVIVRRIGFAETETCKITNGYPQLILPFKYRKALLLMPVLYLISIMWCNLMYMPAWQNNYSLFKKICERDNANFRGQAILAHIELTNNNLVAATELTESMQIKPWMSKSHKNSIAMFKQFIRGMVFYNQGMNDSALTCFSRLMIPEMLLLDQLTAGVREMVLSTVAKIYMERGNKKQAAVFYSKMSEVIDDETNKYFYRGLAAFLEGELERARIEFSRALEISPGDDKTKANMATVERMLKVK